MTKNELMEMAIAAEAITKGKVTIGEGVTSFGMKQLIEFANTILERAAVELSTYGVIQDMGGADAAEIVRSLKLPTN